MKLNLLLVFAAICLLNFSATNLSAQASACPAVNAGLDQTICGGCTNLTATVQGTVGTTSYTNTSIPYNPYSYTSGPQVLVNIDDIWTSVITIPFCFEFYGNTYTQCVIGSNGLISFNTALASGYCEWDIMAPMPNTSAYDNCIMAPYHDIDPSIGATSEVHYDTYGTAPCREFVISWYNVPMYSAACNSMLASQQIVLHESTNIIDMYIANKPLCAGWNEGGAVQGIINLGGTQSVIVPGRNYPTQWTAVNDGQRFMPTGTPNYTVSWTGPSGPIGSTATVNVCPTTTTTYTATITNNSCAGPIIVSDQVTVTINSTLTASMTSTPSACTANNGTATATPSGGSGNYSYSWAPSGGTAQTATGLAPGTYTVTITDNTSGCITTQTVSVGNVGNITSTAAQTNESCFASADGSATMTVVGGTAPFTYTWTPNVSTTSTASGLTSGTYTCVATDANGCTTMQVFTLTSPTAVAATQSTISDVSCFGGANGSAQVTASGGTPGYSYLWTPTGGTNDTATALNAGSYIVTITDANGCTGSVSLQITEPPMLTLSTTSTPVNCLQLGTATATPSGGNPTYSYSWMPSGGTAATESNLAAGTYTVLVTDANGCTISQSVTVTQIATMSVTATSTDVTCFGGSTGTASVTPSGGNGPYTYQWSPSGGTSANATGLTAGSYTCLITDSQGCTATQTVVVSEPTQISGSTSGTSPLCNGGTDGSAFITVSGGIGPYTYNWTPAGGTSQTATGIGAGSYTCTVTDANGCTYTQTVTLTQPNAITATGTGNQVCPGDNATLLVTASGGTAPYSYAWSNGPTTSTQTLVATTTNAGVYTVTVTDANGCTQTATAALTLLPTPTAAYTTDAVSGVVILTGGAGTICFTDQSTGATSWVWDFNGQGTSTQQSPCFNVTTANAGTFCTELFVTSSGGCVDSILACVEVGQSSYSIPNVFTPNADGTNDNWIITNEGMTRLHCSIYDRWGVMIYEWDGTTGNWDGKTKSGNEAVSGVYYYVATLEDFAGKVYEEQGFFELIH